jgi:hypothetical protein
MNSRDTKQKESFSNHKQTKIMYKKGEEKKTEDNFTDISGHMKRKNK